MLNRAFPVLALCSLGLVACGQTTPPSPGTNNEPITLQLNRLATGGVEYCNDDGQCETLPYEGDCAVIEVDVDPATGATCERCVLEDGSTIDMGCSETSIGCVVVTLPDPDCVVCAYTNGAVIFSTCIANDEPDCYTDQDCSDDGQLGFCIDGMCVYEDGCLSDEDCPEGFMCAWPAGAEGSSPDTWIGTCVPRTIECVDDGDCPNDMYCLIYDYFAEEPGQDGSSPSEPPMIGVCVDRPYDPCQDFPCGEGQHCELRCDDWGMPTPGSSAGAPDPTDPNPGCQPICVADPTTCTSDDDCGAGERCDRICPDEPWMCDAPNGADCMPPECEGICVPDEPHPCDLVDCGPNSHCEVYCTFVDSDCSDPFCGCEPVCVPDPVQCSSDEDCPDGQTCEQSCIEPPSVCFDDDGDGDIDCPPPYCESWCLPTFNECFSNEDCPAGQICERPVGPFPCEFGDPSCDNDQPLPGVCMPAPVCESDEDCVDPMTGQQGSCWDGWCLYDQYMYCYSDADCLDGEMCEPLPHFAPCPADDPSCVLPGMCVPRPDDGCFRTGCSGEICADVPVDTTCEYPAEYACYDLAVCERQVDGQCGWTLTDDARACFDEANG